MNFFTKRKYRNLMHLGSKIIRELKNVKGQDKISIKNGKSNAVQINEETELTTLKCDKYVRTQRQTVKGAKKSLCIK